jgi:hypothetical protein
MDWLVEVDQEPDHLVRRTWNQYPYFHADLTKRRFCSQRSEARKQSLEILTVCIISKLRNVVCGNRQ